MCVRRREGGTSRLHGSRSTSPKPRGAGQRGLEAMGTRGRGRTRQPRDSAAALPAPQAERAPPPSRGLPHGARVSPVCCQLSFADSGAISFLSAAFANLGSDDQL